MKKEKEKKNHTKPEGDGQKYEKLIIDSIEYKTKLTNKYLSKPAYAAFNPNILTAFIPGTVTDIFVTTGEKVSKGQDLLILEAMKMLNEIKAPEDAVVKLVNVNKGDRVSKNQILIELE